MAYTQRDKEYHSNYNKEHRDRYLEYKRIWIRKYRAGLTIKTTTLPEKERKKRRRADGGIACKICEILLTSPYSGKPENGFCEGCLKVV